MVITKDILEKFYPKDFDPAVDHAVVSMIMLSRNDPPKGTQEYNKMVDMGKFIIEKSSTIGYVLLSPLAKLILGDDFPMIALRTALNKCGLAEPLTSD